MYLKKRLLSAAAVIVMAAAVFYGSSLEMRTVEEQPEEYSWFSHKDTIYFWYSDENMTNFINSAAVSFGEKEDVRVIPVLTGESEYLEAVNDASLHSEQIPDAYLISHDSLEKAYLAGLAEEIQDSSNICNTGYFPEAAISAVTYHDKKVAYPLYFETSALVYNETYLAEWASQIAQKEMLNDAEEDESEGEQQEDSQGLSVNEEALKELTEAYFMEAVPATVDSILNIADTFDPPEGVEGIFEWAVSDIFYNYWFVGNYMNVGGEAGDRRDEIDVNNAETKECLEVYKALNQFFSIESSKVTYETAIQDFIDGKTVFTIGTTDVVRRLEDAKASGELACDYGVALMPDVSEKLQSRSMSVTASVAVNGYSRHKELANQFAAYLVNECAGNLYDRTGKVPCKAVSGTEEGPLQIFRMEYKESIPLPKMMETGNFWLQLERLFARVWDGSDVSEGVEQLADSLGVK